MGLVHLLLPVYLSSRQKPLDSQPCLLSIERTLISTSCWDNEAFTRVCKFYLAKSLYFPLSNISLYPAHTMYEYKSTAVEWRCLMHAEDSRTRDRFRLPIYLQRCVGNFTSNENPATVTMNIAVCWVVKQCRLVEIYWRRNLLT